MAKFELRAKKMERAEWRTGILLSRLVPQGVEASPIILFGSAAKTTT